MQKKETILKFYHIINITSFKFYGNFRQRFSIHIKKYKPELHNRLHAAIQVEHFYMDDLFIDC